jgi:hypothetical protein
VWANKILNIQKTQRIITVRRGLIDIPLSQKLVKIIEITDDLGIEWFRVECDGVHVQGPRNKTATARRYKYEKEVKLKLLKAKMLLLLKVFCDIGKQCCVMIAVRWVRS